MYGGIIRQVFVHHATFCINSLAHTFGDHTFDDERSPRDNIITAFITFGEGYHNFHHEFPNDWRNGIRWYDFDPTKWLIRFFSLFGLAFEMQEAPQYEISKGKLTMESKSLQKRFHQLHGTTESTKLPSINWHEVRELCKSGRDIVVVDDYALDVTAFIPDHPGGTGVLKPLSGKDATKAFHGKTGVYKHSKAARHFAIALRIAKLDESSNPMPN